MNRLFRTRAQTWIAISFITVAAGWMAVKPLQSVHANDAPADGVAAQTALADVKTSEQAEADMAQAALDAAGRETEAADVLLNDAEQCNRANYLQDLETVIYWAGQYSNDRDDYYRLRTKAQGVLTSATATINAIVNSSDRADFQGYLNTDAAQQTTSDGTIQLAESQQEQANQIENQAFAALGRCPPPQDGQGGNDPTGGGLMPGPIILPPTIDPGGSAPPPGAGSDDGSRPHKPALPGTLGGDDNGSGQGQQDGPGSGPTSSSEPLPSSGDKAGTAVTASITAENAGEENDAQLTPSRPPMPPVTAQHAQAGLVSEATVRAGQPESTTAAVVSGAPARVTTPEQPATTAATTPEAELAAERTATAQQGGPTPITVSDSPAKDTQPAADTSSRPKAGPTAVAIDAPGQSHSGSTHPSGSAAAASEIGTETGSPAIVIGH